MAAPAIPIECFRIVIIIVEWRWKLEWKMDNNNNTNSDEMIMKCGIRDCVSEICDHPVNVAHCRRRHGGI